jgi:hypothetical protein
MKLTARDEITLTDLGPGRHHEPIERDTFIGKVGGDSFYLNEKQRRLASATDARSLGCGGISRVARASGVSCPTIQQGTDERDHLTTARMRQAGGGRQKNARMTPRG